MNSERKGRRQEEKGDVEGRNRETRKATEQRGIMGAGGKDGQLRIISDDSQILNKEYFSELLERACF